jgi:hypothetical protein
VLVQSLVVVVQEPVKICPSTHYIQVHIIFWYTCYDLNYKYQWNRCIGTWKLHFDIPLVYQSICKNDSHKRQNKVTKNNKLIHFFNLHTKEYSFFGTVTAISPTSITIECVITNVLHIFGISFDSESGCFVQFF